MGDSDSEGGGHTHEVKRVDSRESSDPKVPQVETPPLTVSSGEHKAGENKGKRDGHIADLLDLTEWLGHSSRGPCMDGKDVDGGHESGSG